MHHSGHFQCRNGIFNYATFNTNNTAHTALCQNCNKLSIISQIKPASGGPASDGKSNYMATLSCPVNYVYQFKEAALPKTRLTAFVSHF